MRPAAKSLLAITGFAGFIGLAAPATAETAYFLMQGPGTRLWVFAEVYPDEICADFVARFRTEGEFQMHSPHRPFNIGRVKRVVCLRGDGSAYDDGGETVPPAVPRAPGEALIRAEEEEPRSNQLRTGPAAPATAAVDIPLGAEHYQEAVVLLQDGWIKNGDGTRTKRPRLWFKNHLYPQAYCKDLVEQFRERGEFEVYGSIDAIAPSRVKRVVCLRHDGSAYDATGETAAPLPEDYEKPERYLPKRDR